jgi:uncharacterized protein YdhG (YjbR/CyaY superfamily)
MNMFKPTKAKSVQEYLRALPADRREPIEFLHALIQKTSPKLKPHFAYNMLGYGSFRYQNYKKEIIDWPVVALASQKRYMSLYVCALADGEYLAEKYQHELGNVSVGKSCIRFKKLSDLNLTALKKVIKLAARSPGLVATEKTKKK